MTNEELGRRAVACKGWRWMPGMLSQDTGLRLDEMTDEWEGKVPDFSDPATLGCLLALVREAWSDSGVYVWCDLPVGLWCWMANGCSHSVHRPSDEDGYDTEAEALVAALEAAK